MSDEKDKVTEDSEETPAAEEQAEEAAAEQSDAESSEADAAEVKAEEPDADDDSSDNSDENDSDENDSDENASDEDDSDEDDSDENDSDEEASSEDEEDEEDEAEESDAGDSEAGDDGHGHGHGHDDHGDHGDPSVAGVAAIFDHPDHLMYAAIQARESEYEAFDAFSPFPIHGMDDAMGLGRSWIPWVTFLAGVTGFSFANFMQFGIMWYDWPMIFGGRPFAAWPSFVPIIFELTVLFAGHTTAFVMLYAAGCFRKPLILDPEITNDRFVLYISATDEQFDRDAVVEFMKDLNPMEVRTVRKEGRS